MHDADHLTVHDLPLREQVKAFLPATAAILSLVSIIAVALAIWTLQQETQTRSEVSYSINRSVCGFRRLANDSIKRAELILSASGRNAPSAAVRKSSETAISQARSFLATQVTVPRNFDCARLPK